MKHSFNGGSWHWIEDSCISMKEIRDLPNIQACMKSWKENESGHPTNFLMVETENPNEEAYLYGSLVFQQDIKVRENKKILHFYLAKSYLALFGGEFMEQNRKMLDNKEDAIDGFLVMVESILKSYLKNIDEFEERLHNLIWKIQEQNNLQTLEQVYDTRHELLVWRNLLIPIKELKIGLEEAYDEEISNRASFKRFAKKLERAKMLLADYQQEIDTMINLEEVVSSHRGNEIMKTLTVITILFTPIAALGALWGMNFDIMPELKWSYGYLFAIMSILVSTVGLYVYLHYKGWTGDILKGKKKNKYFQ